MPDSVKKLTLTLLPALLFLYSYVFGFECVFRRWFGIICPGCGMTGAVRALLALDIQRAAACHPMVFSLPVILIYIFMNGRVFKNRYVNYGILSAVGAGFLVNYLIRLGILYWGG